jgi:hypothetical protein
VSIIGLPTKWISPTAFGPQIRLGLGARGEQKLGDCVGDEPVDLLGHCSVETPKSGLDMGQGDAEFRCDERPGQSAVDIAVDDKHPTPVRDQFGFQGNHDIAGLRCVAAGADAQIYVRGRQPELADTSERASL